MVRVSVIQIQTVLVAELKPVDPVAEVDDEVQLAVVQFHSDEVPRSRRTAVVHQKTIRLRGSELKLYRTAPVEVQSGQDQIGALPDERDALVAWSYYGPAIRTGQVDVTVDDDVIRTWVTPVEVNQVNLFRETATRKDGLRVVNDGKAISVIGDW